ncbi:MAG: site-2 protease family protein [Planctomycetes bacterium]|nr:site-2 protease family protein [Planctomycetota bacterium]
MSMQRALLSDGIRLGRLAGIEINLSPSFLPLALLLVVGLDPIAGGLLAAILLAVLLASSIVAHELGHALTARAFGIRTRAITLHLLGGVAKIEGEPRRPAHEILIAAAGPAVSLLLAAIFFGLTWLTALVAGPWQGAFLYLSVANLILAAFNLLPGLPLDGGRILRGILWARSQDRRGATISAARGGEIIAYLIFALAFLRLIDPTGGLVAAFFPALMAWFLLGAARAEKARAELSGRPSGQTRPGLAELLELARRTRPVEVVVSRASRPRSTIDPEREVIRYPDGRELYIERPRRSHPGHDRR